MSSCDHRRFVQTAALGGVLTSVLAASSAEAGDPAIAVRSAKLDRTREIGQVRENMMTARNIMLPRR
jgi:hypothetical protein